MYSNQPMFYSFPHQQVYVLSDGPDTQVFYRNVEIILEFILLTKAESSVNHFSSTFQIHGKPKDV